MTKIVQKEEKVLRKVAEEVTATVFGSTKLQKVLKDMKTALDREEDGVAVAAPQIGISLRIFLVAPKVREIMESPDLPLVYINPEISKISRDKKSMEEGCLSVRGYYGTVKRASRVTVTAYNEAGEKFTRGASGLLAQIFQHETDHLNGILFIDHAKNIKELELQK
jgi:peptide deformylase